MTKIPHIQEIFEHVEFSRRSLIQSLALGGAVLAAGAGVASIASAENIPVSSGGKKVKVGIPLTYGPFNQPWRRGMGTMVKTVLDNGGEVVTIRGEPTKQSELDAMRQLLDRGIDVLCMGNYATESETAYIAEDAHRRGIKTVGFQVTVKDSPSVVEDTWGLATALGYFVQNALKRQGNIVQTAEDKGFFQPFDMEAAQLEMMTSFEPRMKVLPFMSGSTSGSDQISKGRENVLSLLQANPDPASINAIISWWWPLSIGAVQGLNQMNRTNIMIANHYFSEQLLEEMARPESPIAFSTDTPWDIVGEKTAQLALALGRGENVPNDVFRTPVRAITRDQAAETLAKLRKDDAEAIAILKQYGG
jgi:ABC-type sugar transport system substrate-binding protein